MEKEKDLKPDQIQLPPGFRFYPSDEELIVHYLRKKSNNNPLPAAIIAEVDLYKFNPWDLPMKALFGEEEWYFFTPRDRKYPNGMRPNRMASSGYWKATGTDKPILTSCGAKVIGVKKALVFYTGRPPKGNKTHWIMHEYRLPEATWTAKKERSMRLDDWVLCRVRQKVAMSGNLSGLSKEPAHHHHPKLDKQCPMGATAASNAGMVREYLYKDCPMLPFLMGFQNIPCMDIATVSNICFEGNKISSQTPCMDTTTTTTAGSNISFEGKKTTSSVCEDNFNVDYLQNSVPPFPNNLLNMRKRKIIDGNIEDISFLDPNNRKPVVHREEVPQYSSSNDTTGRVSYSTSQVDRNTSVSNLDQLGSMNMMMYQDLYSLAFT